MRLISPAVIWRCLLTDDLVLYSTELQQQRRLNGIEVLYLSVIMAEQEAAISRPLGVSQYLSSGRRDGRRQLSTTGEHGSRWHYLNALKGFSWWRIPSRLYSHSWRDLQDTDRIQGPKENLPASHFAEKFLLWMIRSQVDRSKHVEDLQGWSEQHSERSGFPVEKTVQFNYKYHWLNGTALFMCIQHNKHPQHFQVWLICLFCYILV